MYIRQAVLSMLLLPETQSCRIPNNTNHKESISIRLFKIADRLPEWCLLCLHGASEAENSLRTIVKSAGVLTDIETLGSRTYGEALTTFSKCSNSLGAHTFYHLGFHLDDAVCLYRRLGFLSETVEMQGYFV